MFNYINDNLQNINDKLDKNFNLKLEGSMNDDEVNNYNFQKVPLKENKNEIIINYKFSYVKIFGRRFVNIW